MKTILGSMTFSDQVNQQVALTMIETFKAAGNVEIDTAYVYCKGKTEELLGALNLDGHLNDTHLATKVNPKAGGLGRASVDKQLTTSLKRLNAASVDLLYLHQPDLHTPIEETLEAVNQHHAAGRFQRLGLSNYAAWQVTDIVHLCERNGFVKPSVYQGMYNALTRDVERELFKCLTHHNIAFYVYNPLAGGMLSGKHSSHTTLPTEGRFSTNQEYQNRYWKHNYFAALEKFVGACVNASIEPSSAALRWLTHHSELSGKKGDGIILGASKLQHFESNLASVTADPLPDTIVAALDEGWELSRADCIKYFRP